MYGSENKDKKKIRLGSAKSKQSQSNFKQQRKNLNRKNSKMRWTALLSEARKSNNTFLMENLYCSFGVSVLFKKF